MPVIKYRSVEEMPGPTPVVPGSRDHWARVAMVWHRASLLHPCSSPPGVRRYRGVDDPARQVTQRRPHQLQG